MLKAQGESPAQPGGAPKKPLPRTYWRPVYSFTRAGARNQTRAEDLTQAFSRCYWSAATSTAVRKEKGRLRSYLLTSLKHFLASEHRRAVTLKRGKGRRPVPLEELRAPSEDGWNQWIHDQPTAFMNAAGH